MTAIFISYRRSTDRQSAARVREQMTRFFDVEDLFLDSESIKAGEDWGDSLSMEIGSAKACLVMIGPWCKGQISQPSRTCRPVSEGCSMFRPSDLTKQAGRRTAVT